ncbi:acyl-CoA thioesterase [Opitutaceae bacterium]|nr:acyl-CoA thioesterase [Opitutaceae bacterium]MDB4474782.1 acyl-CoA thioesterase [Opitutaceae bacterium]
MLAFRYDRTIHFSDTDAAGVVFFARYLSMAHEGYEEALAAHGIPLEKFFADNGVIIPIAKSEASYLRPLVTGEKVSIEVSPALLEASSFTIDFTIWKTVPTEKRAAVIRTEHICIDSTTRKKTALPDSLLEWINSES